MALTITEKEQWKDRISRRVDKAIEELVAAVNPNFPQELHAQSRKAALGSLGILELQEKREQAERESIKWGEKAKELVRQLYPLTRQMQVTRTFGIYISEAEEVDQAIARRIEALETELLAHSELGRQILQLRLRKEELLDAVMLATSGRQIEERWKSLSKLLDQAPTSFQAAAVATETIPDVESE